MQNRSCLVHAASVFALVLAGCGGAKNREPATTQAAPVPVGIVALSSQSVALTTNLPGRVLASELAEIRPQVDGIVEKRAFREGSAVKAGDTLYELDATKFRAAHDAAAAGARKMEAGLRSAEAKLERGVQLAKTNSLSTQAVEDARTEVLLAQADVAAAKAAVRTAQINLDYATIKAPIGGVIGTSSVGVGSLVTANQGAPLATVRQVDPIEVDLVDSSANLLRIRAQMSAGSLGRDHDVPPVVELQLEDGSTYSERGKIAVADLVVSEGTGTFGLRATFPNPRRLLLPGMFVRANVHLGVTPTAFLVPQRAVTRNDAGQATAFFATADNRAEMRTLQTGRAVGNDWLVTAGVTNGDRLIVDGLQKITAGSAVAPVVVTIDGNGVVRQTIEPEARAGMSAKGSGTK